MGPFLADRVPTRSTWWLFGVAVVTSTVSLATLPPSPPPTGPAPIWEHHGCTPKRSTQLDSSRPRLMIGPMAEAGTYRDVMRDAVKATLEKTHNWSLEVVDAPPANGYFIDGTVDEFKVSRVGDVSYVECELKLWVRSSGTVVSKLISGSARVKTTQAQRDVALSRQACVTTVAEDLVERLFAARVE
jgi:hypothetical protein